MYQKLAVSQTWGSGLFIFCVFLTSGYHCRPMTQKVYLVDGSGYIFRAFFAVAPLSTKAGLPTNALFGFTRMLKKLIDQAQSDYIAVVFDSGRETFRRELYADYKANRTEAPDELIPQFPYFPKIAEALGLPVLSLNGFEADDIIGTLATQLSESDNEVIIVSADKDFMQLIKPGISIFDSMNDRAIGQEQVMDKFGVRPEQVIDVLALIGDSSDNIPGMSGVGPKTAAQLIEKYGDVESILSSAEAIRNDKSIRNRTKIAETIESEAEIVRLSRKLATIVTDAPIELSRKGSSYPVSDLDGLTLLELIKKHSPERENLKKLIQELQFESILAPLLDPTAQEEPAEEAAYDYQTVLPENFDVFLQELKQQKVFSFDLETTSLDPLVARIVGLSFCWNDSKAFYLPIGHVTGESGLLGLQSKLTGQLDEKLVLESLKPIFESEQYAKCGQNLKFDMKVLAKNGIALKSVEFDSMIAAYLLNPDRGSYNLTTLAEEYLGKKVIEYDEVTNGSMEFASVELSKATIYACQDAHFAWLLMEKLKPLLEEQELQEVFSKVEMPLIPVLAEMELAGVTLDTELLSKMSLELAGRLSELEKSIYQHAGAEFNLNSPKQLSEILFNKLQISTKGLKKTKTGFSSDAAVLEKIADQHEVPRIMLEYRGLHKLKSTYVDALPQSVSPVSKRLHTSFNQTVTATGRLSSSSPNLQNIPVASAEGAKIRAAFIAPEGKLLISADYSQIELRLLAHLAADKNMREAFEKGIDIHTQTARELLGILNDQPVSSEQRRLGKTMNFAIIYGMGAFRLSKELGIPYGMAQDYIDRYFELYSGVQEFFKLTEAQALEKGYVSTIFGRRRMIKDIDSSGRDKGFILRAALNAPIQGSAADIIKLAMINISGRINKDKYPMELILQIHDELVFEVENAFATEAESIIKREMENVITLSVPLEVESGSGRNWQVAH